MTSLIIASAQIKNIKNNVQDNLEKHYQYIEMAVNENVDLIVFPEMSLTGYEREDALHQAFAWDDKCLEGLQNASDANSMVIVAGGPLLYEQKLYIASFIFMPHEKVKVYFKKHLHEGEDVFFSPFDENEISWGQSQFIFKDHLISPAICYDIEVEDHIKNAADCESSLYMASIFYSQGSINILHEKMKMMAAKYKMNILISNFAGECWETESGGKSAFWSSQGHPVVEAPDNEECLLIAGLSHQQGPFRVDFINKRVN